MSIFKGKTAKDAAIEAYTAFGEQNLPAIKALFADKVDGLWTCDEEKPVTWTDFESWTQTMLAKIGQKFPTIKPHVDKLTSLIETPTKVLLKVPVTTDNGMDALFLHLWETDASGRVCRMHVYDDYHELAKVSTVNAKATALKCYEMFAKGDMEGIEGLYAKGKKHEIRWNSDRGTVTYDNFQGFLTEQLSRMPTDFPGLSITDPEIIAETPTTCVTKVKQTNDLGLDSVAVHFWETDAEGGLLKWYGMDDGKALQDATASSAKNLAMKCYDYFAKGDVESIIALYAEEADCVWYGDKGVEKTNSIREMFANTFSRLNVDWPGFKVTFKEELSATPNAFYCKCTETSDGGLESDTYHMWRTNSEGKLCSWHGFSDTKALLAANVNAAK